MRDIIRDGSVVRDAFERWVDGQPLPELAIVNLAQVEDASAQRRPDALGLCVPGDAEVESVLPWLERVSVLAIEFPKFTDGRGYSLARLLRERHGFRGELRAVGDVLRDQLFYMKRCGFNAFEIRSDKSVTDALRSLSDFTVTYQADALDPRPVYAR